MKLQLCILYQGIHAWAMKYPLFLQYIQAEVLAVVTHIVWTSWQCVWPSWQCGIVWHSVA
jgi:hypothetical protein